MDRMVELDEMRPVSCLCLDLAGLATAAGGRGGFDELAQLPFHIEKPPIGLDWAG